MKLSKNVLGRYTDIPDSARDLRLLLDDVGVEVKKVNDSATDTVFTVELLANRGDHHSYFGIATELSGRSGAGRKMPEVAALTPGESVLQVSCETDKCLTYTATLLEHDETTTAGLTAEMLAPLTAADIHSISPPIDATNLANLEIGQPTHVFDADTIVGGITIRLSRPNEQALPLFAESTIVLPPNTVVIADDEKVLAIAGVIGCESSKTTDTTRRIILESATFDPISVRKTARALNILTDSSARFERGSDPSLPLIGAGRVVALLRDCGWSVEGATSVVGSYHDPHREITLEVGATAAFLNFDISKEEMAERLSRYGFTFGAANPGQLVVVVPPGRIWDVEFPADIYEELAKSIGYNEIPTTIPAAALGATPSHHEEVKARVEEVLLGAGFFEIFTDGFYSRSLLDKLALPEDHPLHAHVETRNALDRGYSLVKNNNLAQALEAVSTNIRMKNTEVKAYEWTRTFHLDPAAQNGLCTEHEVLWAIVSGHDSEPNWAHRERTADPLFIKGVIEELSLELSLPFAIQPLDQNDPLASSLHPSRAASIYLGTQPVGIFGEIHPTVVANFKLKKARPVFFQIGKSALMGEASSKIIIEPSSTHPVDRSLAFTLPRGLTADEVATHMIKIGPEYLDRVIIDDLYEHKNSSGDPVRTITFNLIYSTEQSSKTAEQVNAESQALIDGVIVRFGDLGVSLRA